MKRALFDDVGSYPLPEGTAKEWIKEAFAKIHVEPEPTSYKDKLYGIIKDAGWQKLNANAEELIVFFELFLVYQR